MEGFGRREINSPIAFSIKTPAGTLLSTAFFLASMESGGALVMSRNTFGCVRGADYCGVCSFFPPRRRRRAELCAVSHLPVCLFINNCIAHIFICTSEKRRRRKETKKREGTYSRRRWNRKIAFPTKQGWCLLNLCFVVCMYGFPHLDFVFAR